MQGLRGNLCTSQVQMAARGQHALTVESSEAVANLRSLGAMHTPHTLSLCAGKAYV